jgi:putative FmdB family regulatory protein
MPLYTYKCTTCNEHETHLVKINDDTENKNNFICPLCGGIQSRIFDASDTSFILKGDWFKTTGKY